MKNTTLLRVISGKYRSKGISSPKGQDIRPTSSRVKDSFFNIVRNKIYGCCFLDLFSGTGQIGIEAASIGANVTFCDKDISLTRQNALKIGVENAQFVQGDFQAVLTQFRTQNKLFDIIFADPPYKMGYYEKIIELCLPLLKENGTLVLEHASDIEINTGSCTVKDKRVYSSRSLTFLGV